MIQIVCPLGVFFLMLIFFLLKHLNSPIEFSGCPIGVFSFTNRLRAVSRLIKLLGLPASPNRYIYPFVIFFVFFFQNSHLFLLLMSVTFSSVKFVDCMSRNSASPPSSLLCSRLLLGLLSRLNLPVCFLFLFNLCCFIFVVFVLWPVCCVFVIAVSLCSSFVVFVAIFCWTWGHLRFA